MIEAAEEGARQRTDAADDRRGERFQRQRRRQPIADRPVGRRHRRAGEAGERPGQREGARRQVAAGLTPSISAASGSSA